MQRPIEVVYGKGVFKPLEKVKLKKGETITTKVTKVEFEVQTAKEILIEKSASINVVVSAFVIRSLLNKQVLTQDNTKTVLDRIARDRDLLESKNYEELKKWLTKKYAIRKFHYGGDPTCWRVSRTIP